MGMKKLCALMLATVMGIGAVTGCGNGNANSNGSGNSSGSDVSENKEDPYEIVIELMNFGTTHPDEAEVVEAINNITLPAINATVKFLPVAIPDHATKLGLLAAGGDKLDLIVAGVTVSPANLVADGVLTDLTDLLPDNAPDLVAMEGDLMASGTYDGRVYTLSGTLYPGAKKGLLYNKDMAEEYGINVPEKLDTFEDWDAFLKECKEKLPENVYPLTLGDGGAENAWNIGYFDAMGDSSYLTYGVLTDIVDGTEVSNWYESDTYKELVTKKHEWYDAGYCVPDSMTSGFTANDDMKAGKCFMKFDGLGAAKNEANCGSSLAINMGAIVLADSIVTNTDIYKYNWGVPITSEKPEKVVQFLNLLFTNPDLMNLLNFGIEGKHWVKTAENSKVITYPEGVTAADVGWSGAPAWWGDHEQAYTLTPNTDEYYTLIKTYGVEDSVISNALGYTFDTTNVKTELAAIQNVIDTYRPSLECGLVDVDTELPKFQQALKDAGIDKVIEENQKQFTEWLSKK